MATSVWKGIISFGLVSIPIRLFAAARLNELIEAKLKGKTITTLPQKGKAPVIDMMEALKKSLAGTSAPPRKAVPATARRQRRKAS